VLLYDHGHDRGHIGRHFVIIISKSKLKAHMLEVFRRVEETGEEVVVTDRGRAVLRIQPIGRARSVDEVFGAVREGGIHYAEDPDTPTVGEGSET
jgi:prevent-host-death family protein